METAPLTERAQSPAATPPGSATPTPGALGGRAMASAALLVMLFFVLSRLTGLAREIIVGARFGAGAGLDAYLAAFRLPDLLFQLVAGGALGSAFIPIFAGYWVNGDRSGAWLLFSRVLNLITAILVVFAAVGAVFALPIVQHIIAPGFPPEQQVLTAHLMRWMLVSTVLFGASGLIMGALNALQHFLLPAAAPVVYNLAIIAGAWFLVPVWGVYGLVIGVVAGSLGHLLVQIPGLVWKRARYTWDWRAADPGVREVGRLMGPRVLGLFFVQLHFLVNTILASRLSPGSISALNFAWLLMLLPLGVFAQAIATAAFPTFAAQVAAGEGEAMRRTFGQILRTVFFLTIPAAVGLWLLRVPVITVLFQRGEFSATSTALVAFALQFYALGLVSHSAVEITVRGFYALHNTWTPVLAGMAAMALNILLSLLLVQPLSFGGLALANTTATTLEMLALLFLLNRRMGGLEGRALLATITRSLIAAALMGLALWWWLQQGWTNVWFTALGGVALASALYLSVSLLLRSPELAPLVRRMKR